MQSGFIDRELEKNYAELERSVAAGKTTLEEDHLHNMAIHYLYTRSFSSINQWTNH